MGQAVMGQAVIGQGGAGRADAGRWTLRAVGIIDPICVYPLQVVTIAAPAKPGLR